MKLNKFGIILCFYFTSLIILVVYSYSQIDLNLTLSSNYLYQTFQKQLIYLGYYNRPFSTLIYLLLLLMLYAFYFYILVSAIRHKLIFKQAIQLIIVSAVIVFFSYPAFSHDIFNYMFDARIVTKYHLNPYLYSAMDFPNDLWIRFMHWTHRVYPYGPVWLLITLPFSFFGFGKFVFTLCLFKLMFVFFHLGNTFLISRILKKVNPNRELLGIAIYGLNPLILIESLVSPHSEVVMLFFLLVAINTMVSQKNHFLKIIFFLFSVGIKFTTFILAPFFIFSDRISKKWRINTIFRMLIIFLTLPLIFQISIREAYPWYFIPFIGLSALIPESKNINVLIISISIGALLRYVPYLFTGAYGSLASWIQLVLFMLPILIVTIWVAVRLIMKNQWYNDMAC